MEGSDLVRLSVSSPVSEVPIKSGNAPRFETLNGKTICEVWATGHYGADLTFPTIRKIVQEKYPEVKFVPFTEFPKGKPKATERWVPLDQVAETLRNKKCDAVLVGNGG